MKTVNPFYILGALFVVFLLLISQLSSAKSSLETAKTDYFVIQQMAEYTSDLKKNWASKKRNKTALLRLLNSAQLRDSTLDNKVKSDRIVITSKELGSKEATYLTNKLLNGTFTVLSFKLKRLDENTIDIKIEVKL
jgi:flavin-dependent dehydrogenase